MFTDCLKKGKKINGEYYATLLQRYKKKGETAVFGDFHRDNAPVHTSIIVILAFSRTLFARSRIQRLFSFFKRFVNNEEVESAVNSYIEGVWRFLL